MNFYSEVNLGQHECGKLQQLCSQIYLLHLYNCTLIFLLQICLMVLSTSFLYDLVSVNAHSYLPICSSIEFLIFFNPFK